MRLSDKLKKKLILNSPYILFIWIFGKVAQAIRLAPGIDASQKLLHIGEGFATAFSNMLPSFHPLDLLIGVVGAVIIRLAVYVKGKNAQEVPKEHGIWLCPLGYS